MALSTAERNRRKRERKKREREERKKQEEEEKDKNETDKEESGDDVEIEYVEDTVGAAANRQLPDGVPQDVDEEGIESVLQRFQQRAAVIVVTDDEKSPGAAASQDDGDSADGNDDGDNKNALSNRKMRELLRPSVADLKRRVKRPDLVEAHDVTSADPDFLIYLKSTPNSVPVPRHWGRKRKYLQGKRGFEKPPFQLPDFIVKTGITALRDTVAADEAKMSAKQKNRSRVAPKMGAMDVDYRTLYEAFFKHQSKPKSLTGFGDLYYEGKELETRTAIKPGGPLSKALREALGMVSEMSPPPWLLNMQRYGPPPSYPGLKIPGLNAPLPNEHCQYGYHPGGWGKPPVDAFGRPLYGGNPFGKPGKADDDALLDATLVTSDGKALGRVNWGALPNAEFTHTEEGGDGDDDEEEESSDEEMEESEGEVEEEEPADGAESVLPPPARIPTTTAPGDLRKQPGDETPLVSAAPKQLYQVLDQTTADSSAQAGVVFASEVSYVLPGGTAPSAAAVPEGAESVLSKALPSSESSKQKRKLDDDDEESEELKKKFKF